MRHRPESGQLAAVQAAATRQVSNAAFAHAVNVWRRWHGIQCALHFLSHESFVLQHGACKLCMPNQETSLPYLLTIVPEERYYVPCITRM